MSDEYPIFEHAELGPVTVSPMREDELALVLSSWMHSSDWRRREMKEVLVDGEVLVARDDNGLALGWLAKRGEVLVHGFVKPGYRGVGLARLMWEVAGAPREHVDNPGNRRVSRVLARLMGAK